MILVFQCGDPPTIPLPISLSPRLVLCTGIGTHRSIGDPSADDTTEHRKKMGRWREDAHALVNDPMFFRVLDVAERCHRIVEHQMNFLTKKYSVAEVEQHGLQLAQLVFGRAGTFLMEYSSVFEPEHLAWADNIVQSGLESSLKSGLLALLVELNCHHAASFKRRVCTPLEKFPT